MSLIQPLPASPLDIVGDIHGEIDALLQLLGHLGYDRQGHHPEGRMLVFVGDFCDRGPDSPAVLELARALVQSGRALAVLGNHEINLLREDVKDGSGWFFDARMARDQEKYAPFHRPTSQQRREIVEFLSGLPIALERPDLRVIHAAWQDAQIEAVRPLPLGSVREEYDRWEELGRQQARESALEERMAKELEQWEHGLESHKHQPPFLHAHAEFEANKQMLNPLKVLTSGVEQKGTATFFAGGKWRFVKRVPWWDAYTDPTPVVVGHYWRRVHQIDRSAVGKGDADLFENTHPYAWHGARGNVFCVDFSVGGRWLARKSATPVGRDFKLAALRWPERVLQFDDGHVQATQGFGVEHGSSKIQNQPADEL
ncbi:metallophosphoesterase [Ottowia sp. VDI28]|uniref:metallophosphoesterase n=1 Tax=Ottowia sp. VDI28 TaxID=3133968 RepID=UPI003C2F75D6